MLRFNHGLTLFCLCAAAVASAGDPPPAPALTRPPARTAGPETRNLGSLGLLERDSWFWRGVHALVSRKDPLTDAAYGGAARRAVAPFLPYAGLVIRDIYLIGREAFGEVVLDTTTTITEERTAELVTRASPAERALNALAPRTSLARVRHFLRFREGDRLDPFAMADSERLLRQEASIQDAKIEIVQWEGRPGEVEVLILLRDRWPWGVKGKIKTAEAYNVELWHRNLGGRGISAEGEAIYTRGTSPTVGWRGQVATTNLNGTFVNVAAEARRAWELEETSLVADRGFAHPDLRVVAGWNLSDRVDRDNRELPSGTPLRTRTRGTWLGWGFPVRRADQRDRGRMRLIPAVGFERVDFRDPPRAFAAHDDQWRDVSRYLGQVNLVGLDYYTTSLVYSYGETEDIPAGSWAALTGGFEQGETADRLYYGVRAVWPRFIQDRRYIAPGVSWGGFRERGHFEDGVLDVRLTGFGPLWRQNYGYWRHFYGVSYTRGVNRSQTGTLRLDADALRDLDSDQVTGDQRLLLGTESILFTPYAFFGFKLAAFGYAAGGLVAEETEPLFQQRLYTDFGLGLRLNNPSLVLQTIELRLGVLNGEDGWDAVATVRMGEIEFLGGELPSPRPSVLAYR